MELGALLHCSRGVPPQPKGARLKEDALQRLLSVGRPHALQQQPPPPPPQPSSPPSSPGCATPSTPTLSPLTTCASLTDLPLLSDLLDCHPPPSLSSRTPAAPAGKGAHVSALLSQRRQQQQQQHAPPPTTPSTRAPPDELFHRLHVAAVPSTRARDRAAARAAEADAEPARRSRRASSSAQRRQPPKARVLLADGSWEEEQEEDPRRRGTAFERLHRDGVAWGARGAELEKAARRRRAARESGEASMLEVSAANRHRPRLSSGSRRRTRSVPAGHAFDRLSTHGAARSRKRCAQREAEAADAAARAANPWEEAERQWRAPLSDPPSRGAGAAAGGGGVWAEPSRGRRKEGMGGEDEEEGEEVEEEAEVVVVEEPFRPNVQALHPGMVLRVAPASREASAKYVSERLFNDSAHRRERRESERLAADTQRKKKIARAHARAMNRTAG